jgi:hypothetical protein
MTELFIRRILALSLRHQKNAAMVMRTSIRRTKRNTPTRNRANIGTKIHSATTIK